MSEEQPKLPARWQIALSKLSNWALKGLLWVVLLFLLLNVIFQIPPIQNWIVKKIAAAVAEQTGTPVEVDGFYLGFFNRLTITGVYVQDYENSRDTLMYAQKIKASIIPNPIRLLRSGLLVRNLTLTDAKVHLRRMEKGGKLNMELFFERLFPPKDKPKTTPRYFSLALRKVDLTRVSFLKEDKLEGKFLLIYLDDGHVRLGKLSFPGPIEVQSLQLNRPYVRVEEHPFGPGYQTIALDLNAEEEEDTTVSDFQFMIDKFQMTDGRFSFHNYDKAPVKITPPDELDYQHMEVYNINMDVSRFGLKEEVFSGAVQRISFRDSSGFILNRLSADEAIVSSKAVELNCFELVTPYTYLGDTLALRYRSYPDFKSFNDEVRIDGRINNSFVALRDIMTFAPGLKNNTFFSSNKNTTLRIEGKVNGKVNNLRGRDLNFQLEDGSLFKGDFSSRNLAVRNEEILNLRLEQLTTSMKTLRQLIPDFNPPENFDRLGQLNFKGSFDGFFVDFVAYGDLRTNIGRATMDMRMNLKQGRRKASYSGKLSLIDFNLGRWSRNPDFGVVNFTSEVKNGVGLTGATANAELSAQVKNFIYKGYNYQNAQLTGKLNKSLFDGDFSIRDDNIDFNFFGKLNFSDTVPAYNFSATVNKIDLKALNLIKEDITLAGNVQLDLRSVKGGEADGEVRIYNLLLTHNQADSYEIDSIVAESALNFTGQRIFTLQSDIMHAEVEGRYRLDQIPQYLLQYISHNYPGFAKRLGIKPNLPAKVPDIYFNYDINLLDSKGLHWLVSGKLDRLKDIHVHGYFDQAKDSLVVDVETPRLKYDNLEFSNILVVFNGRRETSDFNVIIDSTYLNGKYILPTLTLLSQIQSDTVLFGINYLNESFGFLDNLNLNGTFYLVDTSFYEIRFQQSNLVILNDLWKINEENYITFGKQYFETRNFQLEHADRKILLEKVGKKGLQLSLQNFDLNFIDEYWDYDPLNFSGKFNSIVTVGDIFELNNIHALITANNLYINDDDFGNLTLNAFAPNFKGRAETRLEIKKDTAELVATAIYNIANLEENRGGKTTSDKRANYFDLGVKIKGYPLTIAQYFIGSTLRDVEGTFGADLRFNGPLKTPEVSGYIIANNGGFTVDYLKTRYTFASSFIQAGNYLFDATGTLLKDKYGHTATLYGGISHSRLKNLGVKARLRTSRFLALDTKKGDNKLFYGQAIGAGEVRFNGPFDQVDIYVNASVGDSTHIVIPISYQRDASELNVHFVDKHGKKDKLGLNNSLKTNEISGLNLEMDLTINDEAQMELVFNEQTGDIIRGSGRGDIRILVPRGGSEFQMFGDYTISQGNYLFTLYNVVNKDFRIKSGGRIQWSGDPFGARIQLEAEYKDLKTSVANFIQEYLVNADASLKNDASKATNVELTLMLEGELLRPQINFDINFPQLTGQLQTYTEGKLRLLKQDQNELNRQVFGLIVVGQFLPSDLSFQGTEIIYNTVSEFVSNQLSLLLTELFSEAVGETSVFSGLDFDIAYNQYRNVDLGEGQDISGGDEFQLTIRQNFLNDRLTVQVGGNVDIGNNIRTAPEASGTFIGNDLIIEYILNKNRTLKLKIYQRLQPDIGGGRRLEVGTGVSYRREFDTFSDFLNSFKSSAKKLGKKGGTN